MDDVPDSSDEKSWREITSLLTLYAHKKMARLYWRGLRPSQGGKVPGGIGPEDIAQEAILRTIDGRRTLNLKNGFFGFLCSTVDSLVYHLVHGDENTDSRTMPVTRTGDEIKSDVGLTKSGPFQQAVFNEDVSVYRELIRQHLPKDDPIVHEIFAAVEIGCKKPTEIAEMLGCPVKEIYNAQKRYRRAVETAEKVYLRKGQRHA